MVISTENRQKEQMKMEFGEKMKQIREEKGMTQQAVADKLYVTRQAVSRWECGD
jgi:transcriptional regulator with XRE-family HTH domain